MFAKRMVDAAGARVMNAAGSREILVSQTVGDLVAGSEVVLEDRAPPEIHLPCTVGGKVKLTPSSY